jgi:hypothetical protein
MPHLHPPNWLSEIGKDFRTELIKSVVTGIVGGLVLQAHKLVALFKKSNSLSTRDDGNQSVLPVHRTHSLGMTFSEPTEITGFTISRTK